MKNWTLINVTDNTLADSAGGAFREMTGAQATEQNAILERRGSSNRWVAFHHGRCSHQGCGRQVYREFGIPHPDGKCFNHA